MFHAYRSGKYPISPKAWRKLEAAERRAGISPHEARADAAKAALDAHPPANPAAAASKHNQLIDLEEKALDPRWRPGREAPTIAGALDEDVKYYLDQRIKAIEIAMEANYKAIRQQIAQLRGELGL